MILFLLRIFNQHSGRKACLSRHDPWHLSRGHWMIFLTPIRFGIHIWLISNRFHWQVNRSLTAYSIKQWKLKSFRVQNGFNIMSVIYRSIRSPLLKFEAKNFKQLGIKFWASLSSIRAWRLTVNFWPLKKDDEITEWQGKTTRSTFWCPCQNMLNSKKYVLSFFKGWCWGYPI